MRQRSILLAIILFACVMNRSWPGDAVAAFAPAPKTEAGVKIEELEKKGQDAHKKKEYQQYLDANKAILDVKLTPESVFWTVYSRTTAYYNAACGYALTGDKEKALKHLETAIEMGYDLSKNIREDEDFASLRDDKRFQTLIERAAKIGTEKRQLHGTWQQSGSLWVLLVEGPDHAPSSLVTVSLTLDSLGDIRNPAEYSRWTAFNKKIEGFAKSNTPVVVDGHGGTRSTYQFFVTSISAEKK